MMYIQWRIHIHGGLHGSVQRRAGKTSLASQELAYRRWQRRRAESSTRLYGNVASWDQCDEGM